MNLYDRLKMSPMTARGAAMSIFGARAPSAAPPAVPNVRSMFTPYSARSVVDPGTDNYGYELGQYGAGLNGVSGIGNLGEGQSLPGENPIFGPYAFTDSCPYVFFSSSHSNEIATLLTSGQTANFAIMPALMPLVDQFPLRRELLDAATQGYAYLQQEIANGNAVAKARFDTLDAEMKLHIELVRSILLPHDVTQWCTSPTSRPWTATLQAYQELVSLKQTIQKFADARTQIPPVAHPGEQVDASKLDLDLVTRSRLTQSLNQAKVAAASGNFNPWGNGPDTSTDGGPDQLTYGNQAVNAESSLPAWVAPVGVGVVLVGAAILLLKKKKR